MHNPVDAIVGANIRARRIAIGLSQEALGERLQEPASKSQISSYELGSVPIRANRLVDIAKVLGCHITALFDGVAKATGAIETAAHEVAMAEGDQEALARYSLLPPEIQASLAELMRAMTIALGQQLRVPEATR